MFWNVRAITPNDNLNGREVSINCHLTFFFVLLLVFLFQIAFDDDWVDFGIAIALQCAFSIYCFCHGHNDKIFVLFFPIDN